MLGIVVLHSCAVLLIVNIQDFYNYQYFSVFKIKQIMNSAHFFLFFFLFCFSFHSNYLQTETQIAGISRTSNTVAKAYN